MQCPVDNLSCDHVQLGTVWVDVCPRCQGVWLEEAELPQLIFHFTFPFLRSDGDLLAAWQQAEADGYTAAKDFWQEATLGCPHGHGLMKKHYVLGSTIGVDHCGTCRGFWLSGSELQAVRNQVAPNPRQDTLGRYVIRAGNDMLRDTGGVSTLPQSMVKTAASVLVNPPYLLYVVGTSIAETLLEVIRRRDALATFRADAERTD